MKEVASVVKPLIENLPAPVANESPSALSTFLNDEMKFYGKALCSIATDLDLLLQACRGQVAFSPDLFGIAVSLAQLKVPMKWSLLTQGTFYYLFQIGNTLHGCTEKFVFEC